MRNKLLILFPLLTMPMISCAPMINDVADPEISIVVPDNKLIYAVDEEVDLLLETNFYLDNREDVVWSSSDEEVAIIHNGELHTLRPGEAIIQATYRYDATICDMIEIEVLDQVVYPIDIDIILPREFANFYLGEELQLSATLSPSNANGGIIWESSDPQIASVNNNGLVTTHAIGQVSISAAPSLNSTISKSLTFHIISPLPSAIAIHTPGGSKQVPLGKTLQMRAEVLPDYANQEVIWQSMNQSVATVGADGLVKGLSIGATTIIAASKVSENVMAAFNIEVSENQLGFYQPHEYSMHLSSFLDDRGAPLGAHGEQKLLIIPVAFADGPVWTRAMTDELNTAFFGSSKATNWESVASFYEQSSYGQLHLSGDIYTPITFSDTSVSLASEVGSSLSFKVAQMIYESDLIDDLTLQEHDQNHDGYVDAPVFIYSNPYDGGTFWAWVGWAMGDPDYVRPRFNTHLWASYDFIHRGYGVNGIDAHTYIHETGHLLGLDDYYPYFGHYVAAGKLDMMDNNILDHDVYSKMLLEWTYPYVVDGSQDETIIELNPFESSGESIIINDAWNGSPIDEYLAIEFYTPTGLNEKDAFSIYSGNGIPGYSIPGVKIYHIDSRGVKRDTHYQFESYITDPSEINEDDDLVIGAANSADPDGGWSETDLAGGSYGENYKLIHLMEATGHNSFIDGAGASNATLFVAGDSFTPTAEFFYKDTAFNNGDDVGYTIYIDAVSMDSARIRIVKNS